MLIVLNSMCIVFLSFMVTYLFGLHCSGVYTMGGGLKKINHGKIKDNTNMNSCKFPPSLEEVWKPASVSGASSDNPISDCNSDIVIDADE